MGAGLEKTLSLLLLIVIGLVLKRKIKSKEQVQGIKVIILSIALPATIFIALLKIKVQSSLILLPILALGVNLLLFAGARLVLRLLKYDPDAPRSRTLSLLLPSLAPGLSCFPFLAEYYGEESIALAALADVGNKFFGLILLYLLAMHWYYRLLAKQNTKVENTSNSRLKELFVNLLSEPINMVLVVGIVMLGIGLNLDSLPTFLQSSINRLSLLMTPLVLLFIGLAVKVKKGDLKLIVELLFWRSGIAFLISALLLTVLPTGLALSTLVVAVVFPQSSCSFWPFAHMTAVKNLEGKDGSVNTFDLDLALNMLAFSLPFSTMMILIICSSGSFFTNPAVLLCAAFLFLVIAILPMAFKARGNWKPVFSLQKKEEAVIQEV